MADHAKRPHSRTTADSATEALTALARLLARDAARKAFAALPNEGDVDCDDALSTIPAASNTEPNLREAD